MKKLHGRYLEVYWAYQVMLNVNGISIYTRTYVTTDNDQMGQIYLGEDELKVRRIGHDAMMEQDAVHIGYEADVTAHLLDTNGTKIRITGLLDTGAVVSVMPIKTWERMCFTREDLNPTNLRLAAANRGAIYVVGRTPITVLHMGGRDLWMSFLVVKNLNDADQFILGRDFVRNFDVMIDLNNGLIRIRNPDRKFVKKPIYRIITDENKEPIFLDGKVKLQPGQAVVAIFRMRNLNSLSDSKQVCLVPNPNSQSSVILGRSFSVTRNGLCVSVLLNTLDTTVSIQRGKKLGYALPMRTDYEETQNLRKHSVKDCPYYANKDKILKRINELKSIHKVCRGRALHNCTKYAEAVPCITASAEETCDQLINTWIARHSCPMTFQSDNGTAFVGELTKELMRRSQVAQAHSTTYHPQTNGLVDRQNRTLVSMMRVYCSRYMTDWDRYFPQVMGAYNSTQHSATGVSPHMMLTGHEKSLPLTFFYPEYEGKKTSPQVYVRDVIRHQQELNDLCRRNTQQAQARQRKKFDKKAAGAKAYSVGDYVWVFQNVIPPKGTKKLLKK